MAEPDNTFDDLSVSGRARGTRTCSQYTTYTQTITLKTAKYLHPLFGKKYTALVNNLTLQ